MMQKKKQNREERPAADRFWYDLTHCSGFLRGVSIQVVAGDERSWLRNCSFRVVYSTRAAHSAARNLDYDWQCTSQGVYHWEQTFNHSTGNKRRALESILNCIFTLSAWGVPIVDPSAGYEDYSGDGTESLIRYLQQNCNITHSFSAQTTRECAQHKIMTDVGDILVAVNRLGLLTQKQQQQPDGAVSGFDTKALTRFLDTEPHLGSAHTLRDDICDFVERYESQRVDCIAATLQPWLVTDVVTVTLSYIHFNCPLPYPFSIS